jgi:hypothetical protein
MRGLFIWRYLSAKLKNTPPRPPGLSGENLILEKYETKDVIDQQETWLNMYGGEYGNRV